MSVQREVWLYSKWCSLNYNMSVPIALFLLYSYRINVDAFIHIHKPSPLWPQFISSAAYLLRLSSGILLNYLYLVSSQLISSYSPFCLLTSAPIFEDTIKKVQAGRPQAYSVLLANTAFHFFSWVKWPCKKSGFVIYQIGIPGSLEKPGNTLFTLLSILKWLL